jgi:hypothetical protein
MSFREKVCEDCRWLELIQDSAQSWMLVLGCISVCLYIASIQRALNEVLWMVANAMLKALFL